MTYLLDVNVLIALVVADHVHHDPADNWLANTGESFATCPITQGGLVRLLLRGGQSANTASAVLAALTDDERHEFWPDDLPYRAVPMTGVIGHRQVTDAYLAQLARQRGGRLVTFDRGMAELHDDVSDLIAVDPPSPRTA